METFACIDFFDLDDAAFAPAHCVDGVHSEAAITDKPRYE